LNGVRSFSILFIIFLTLFVNQDCRHSPTGGPHGSIKPMSPPPNGS